MALIFPSNPTLNQVFSTGSLSWTWNGKSWNNGTSILVTSNLVSSSVQFTNGNTNAFDTNSNITVGQITASFAKISGSIFGTASFAILAQTSSYLENSQTASYVVLAQTASYVLNAVSASYSLTASYVALAQTASYISTASYALAALSASYAPNIYVLPNNVVSASAQLSNNGGVAFDTNSNITVNQITASFAKITNLTVEYVTSSVMVITGSNKFGDASNDKQEFTGSVSITGSLSVVGNVTSNNVLSLASGTVALPSLILSTDTTSGMYRIGANNIGVAINAAKVLDISSTGLSVTGALSASGGYNGSVGATTPSTGAFTTLTTTSNVGINVTSSAWDSTYRAIEIGRVGNTVAGFNSGTEVNIAANAYYNAGWKYAVSSLATRYMTDNTGVHIWYNAATGTAGNAITFTERMRLDITGLAVTGALSCTTGANFATSSGNVGIGTASPVGKLDLDGGSSAFTMQFKETSSAYHRLGFQKNGSDLNIGEFSNDGTSFSAILTVDAASDSVGIGTTSPSQLLTFGNATAGLGVGWGDTTGNYANIFAPYSASGLVLATGFQGSRSSDAYTSSYGGSAMYRSGIRLNAFGNGNIQFFTDGSSTVASGAAFTPTERMRITDAGNVGIGTSSPAYKLDVNGVINTNNELRLTGNGTNLTFSNSTSGVTHQLSSDSSGNLNLTTASTTVYQNLYASGNRYHYFVGNVGIGTTSPAYKLDVSGTIADSIGDIRILPQNSQSAAYTTVLSDSGKHILHPSADTTARTFTIDSNTNVAYPIGTAITFVNQNGAGVVTISITSDTMRLAGAGTTGSRTLAANGVATAIKITSTEWIISGTGLT